MAQTYILAMKILNKGARASEFGFFFNVTHLIGSSGFLKAFDRDIKYKFLLAVGCSLETFFEFFTVITECNITCSFYSVYMPVCVVTVPFTDYLFIY